MHEPQGNSVVIAVNALECQLPDTATLLSILQHVELQDERLSLLLEARERLPFGTHPKEVVTCRLPDGRRTKLLCKYGSRTGLHCAHGHRQGVRAERRVYEEILRPLGIPCPRFFRLAHGAPCDPACLIIEYLEEFCFVDACADRLPCEEGARVAARLHQITRSTLGSAAGALPEYDAAYYRGWAQRAVTFLEPWSNAEDIGWIRVLADRCRDWIDPLLRSAPVLIHGEFYPRNVLYCNGHIVLIDWESAALAAGEIDLAALTEGWERKEAEPWEAEYRTARWPDGPPEGHYEALAAARIYFHLRWLGDRPEWAMHQLAEGRVARLRSLAENIGLI